MEFSFSSKEELLDFLQIAKVNEDVISTLATEIEIVYVKANQNLIDSGAYHKQLFYVLSGGFVCRYVNQSTEIERTINFFMNELHPVMACIDAYFTESRTQCELRAFADAAVLVIQKHTLDKLIQKDIVLKLIFDRLLIKALTEENDLKLKIIAYKPEAFYQYLLQTFPIIIQKIPSKYIAELMGISAEWLSKLKSRQKLSG